MSRGRDRRPSAPRPAPPPRKKSATRSLHASAPVTARWADPAALALLAVFAAASLAMVFGPHRVGDVFTETDFYGAYAEGALHWQRLQVDPSRYGVVGPLFELLLGLVGFVVRDLFVAAQLISVAAMTLGLLAWHRAIRTLTSPLAALLALALLASNAQIFRHAWAASTDALAFALLGAAMAALVGGLGRASVRTAGVLLGLSFLTRYTAIVLLPAGAAAVALGWTGVERGRRLRAAGGFLLGFVAIVSPWVILSLASGQRFTMQFHHNLAYDAYARWQGIPWDLYQRDMQSQFPTLYSVFAKNPRLVFDRLVLNLGEHALFDMRDVVGWAVVVPALLGVLLAWRDRVLTRLAPLLVFSLLLYLLLVPIFHSPRYSMALLPAWTALAAYGFASPRFALPAGPGGAWLKPWLVLVPLVLTLMANVTATSRTLDQLPREAREIADRIRPSVRSGERVLARKAHFAFHAGLTPLSFPFTDSLPQLGAYAHAHDVRWLYFSWLEMELRPHFAFLLDTSAHVPGLTPRAVSTDHPAVLYEIGPAFGVMPDWYRDIIQRGLHNARAAVGVKDDDVHSRLVLALWERERGRPEAAQKYLDEALKYAADDDGVRTLYADNLLRTGRLQEAEAEFRALLARNPRDPSLAQGLGWVLHTQGRAREAAEVWRPLIAGMLDPQTLRAMIQVFQASGDPTAAGAAAAQLRSVGGTP